MLEKEFRPDMLYGKIVRYYIDKKGYDKSKANSIAQHVVQKETQRRICKTEKCNHFSHDHIRNTGVCLVNGCNCNKFTKSIHMLSSSLSTIKNTKNTIINTQKAKTEIMIN